MMAKDFNLPTFSEVVDLLLPITINWEGKDWTIDDWRKHYLKQVKVHRQEKSKIRIFNRFVAALLQGYRIKSENEKLRIECMNNSIRSFSDITEELIRKLLRSVDGNYNLNSRIRIVLDAKEIAAPSSFSWERYFQEAEREYESGYTDDKFLKVKGVGSKLRGYAIRKFSTAWCAIDTHIADVLLYTGLLFHGYGEPGFGCEPANKKNNLFMQRLLIRFAKESGWFPGSTKGYSPGEIDVMFWHFGHEICKDKPKYSRCPITHLCLSKKMGKCPR